MAERDDLRHPDDHKVLGKHDPNPSAGDLVGEAAGGIGGVTAGAAIGSLAGPIGTVIGGIAGAVGGWWAGRAASEAIGKYTDDDDRFYRDDYDASTHRLADRGYDDIRPAYQLGHVAGTNPDYRDREWEAIEPDLRRGWTDDLRTRHGDWETVSPFARSAYTRSRTAAIGGAAAGAVREAGHRTANAIDDLKDRVDGNPASRPGPDSTDSRAR